jgi:hypothetical protein
MASSTSARGLDTLHVITAGEEFHLALRTYAAFRARGGRARNLAQCPKRHQGNGCAALHELFLFLVHIVDSNAFPARLLRRTRLNHRTET